MNINDPHVREWKRVTNVTYPEDLTDQERTQMEKNAARMELYTCLYSTTDGSDVRGYVVVPSERREDMLPAVFYARGGYGELGSISDYLLLTTLSELASDGYVVLATDYREEANSPEDEVEDLLALHDVATALPVVDKDRIALMGVSRGGLVVYRALPKAEWAKAAVSIAGIADLEAAVQRRPEAKAVLEAHYGNDLSDFSVLQHPEQFPETPLLLIHGEEDTRVDVSDSRELADALHRAEKPVTLVTYQGAGHYLEEVEDEYLSEIDRWLKKNL